MAETSCQAFMPEKDACCQGLNAPVTVCNVSAVPGLAQISS